MSDNYYILNCCALLYSGIKMKKLLLNSYISWFVFPGMLLLTIPVYADFDHLKTGHEILIPPDIDMPELHKSYIDPIFKTKIIRISSPEQVNGVSRIRHYYSKSNPFNADESRAIMYGSEGSIWLYDTSSWKPLNSLKIISSDPEIQWHPTDPNIFYFMDFVGNTSNVRGFYKYNIQNKFYTIMNN